MTNRPPARRPARRRSLGGLRSRHARYAAKGWPPLPPAVAEAPLELYKAQLIDIGEARKANRAETAAVRGAMRDQQKSVDGDAIDAVKAKRTSDDEARKAERAAALGHFSKFYETIVTLAAGSVERSHAAAELVQKASAAVAALYTGILALVFSVTDNPLPARGALTPFFLGLAVVLSTAYVAYLGRPDDTTPGPSPAGSVETRAGAQLNTLIEIATKLAVRRSGALRASVVALGVGLAFIVMPFISFSAPAAPTSQPSASPPPAWPAPPAGGDTELNKIRYQAEIDEAAAARVEASKTVATREYDISILLGGLVVGVVAIALVTFLVRPQRRRANRDAEKKLQKQARERSKQLRGQAFTGRSGDLDSLRAAGLVVGRVQEVDKSARTPDGTAPALHVTPPTDEST